MSVETVKVLSASNPNPWEHGITFYDMVFDRNNQPFNCTWGTKGGEPQPGEEVTGEFSKKKDGTWKFSKGSKDKPQSSAAASSGGQRDDLGARIERQAVIKALGHKLSATDTFTSAQRKHIEEIESFIAEAGQAAAPAQGNATAAPESAPPPSASPGSEQQPADPEGKRMQDLLAKAGVEPNEARWLTKEAFSGLMQEHRTIAIARMELGDEDTRAKALARFREIAGPMPGSTKETDLPF